MKQKEIKFIDLFAGIGGIRLGFERAGGECVWSNDYDKYSEITYTENFGKDEFFPGDIKKVNSADLPDFDILCGGFPCQPFSIAGVSKKNSLNKPHGFLDEAQGTLFYEILRFLRERSPKAFFLENVKNLGSHDNGKTFQVIKGSVEELGYSFSYRIVNAKLLLPQNRQRIFMVGFKDKNLDFHFPYIQDQKPKMRDILDKKVDPKYTLTDHLWEYLQNYAAKHKKQGNGFGYGLVDLDGCARTLSARYYKDGSEILIPQKNKNPRRLTPRECARLQGFPEDFKIPVSDTQAYRQFGNSVTVPVIEAIAKEVVKTLQYKPQRDFPYQSERQLALAF